MFLAVIAGGEEKKKKIITFAQVAFLLQSWNLG